VNVSEDHALAAMDLRFAYGPQRLDETHDEDSGISLGDTLGGLDPRVDAAFWRVALAGALRTLPERQRRVLVLRYFDGLTQADTAARLHCSQMHISRLERQALSQLRTVLAQGETARD
jgi:RNA polymerase sigma-B factor